MRKLHFEMSIAPENEENSINEIISKLFDLVCQSEHDDDKFEITEGCLIVKLSFEKLPDELRNISSLIPYKLVKKMFVENYFEPPKKLQETPAKETLLVNVTNEQVVKNMNNSVSLIQTDPYEKQNVTVETKEPEKNNVTNLEHLVQSEKNEEKADQPKSTITNVQKKKRCKGKRELDLKGKEIFDRIVNKSNSFENFIDTFGDNMRIKQYYRGFYKLVIKAACNINSDISWKEIQNEVEKLGEDYNLSKKIEISKYVQKMFENEGSEVTILTFIKEVIKYKNYNFLNVSEKSNAQLVNYKYRVFSKEIVNVVSNENSFYENVERIFDFLNDGKEANSIYKKNKTLIIDVIVDVIEHFDVNLLQEQIKISAKKFIEESDYVIIAEIYQQVKDYCKKINCKEEEKQYIKLFFLDLKHVFSLSK